MAPLKWKQPDKPTNWLSTLPVGVMREIVKYLKADMIKHMNCHLAYVTMDGKVFPLGQMWVLDWQARPINNRVAKVYGNRYAPRLGCGCQCDEHGVLTFHCGCEFVSDTGASFAGYVDNTFRIILVAACAWGAWDGQVYWIYEKRVGF
jgi:hypothetical protein